jgi:hypothetical protein
LNTYSLKICMPLLLLVCGICSNGKGQESKSDAFYTCIFELGCKNVLLTRIQPFNLLDG